MIKVYRNVQKSTKKGICGLQKIKVYRDEVKASKRYAFFHVEFKGNEYFCLFFVNSRLYGCLFQILVKVIQFSVKVRDFLSGRLTGLLQFSLFLIEGVVVATELFDIEVFWIDAETFQHIFCAIVE